MGRLLAAGIVGGILVFMWGFVSHMVLGLTDSAIQPVPDEPGLMAYVKEHLKTPGIYGFPYADSATMKDDAGQKAFAAKYNAGPNGLIVRGRDGEDPMTMRELGLELASDVVGAFLAALIVCWAGMDRSAAAKIFFVTLLGVFAWVSQNASYWIWYRFPTNFEKAELIDAAAQWFFGGIAIAAILRKSAKN